MDAVQPRVRVERLSYAPQDLSLSAVRQDGAAQRCSHAPRSRSCLSRDCRARNRSRRIPRPLLLLQDLPSPGGGDRTARRIHQPRPRRCHRSPARRPHEHGTPAPGPAARFLSQSLRGLSVRLPRLESAAGRDASLPPMDPGETSPAPCASTKFTSVIAPCCWRPTL